jgi:hypothetical protein
MDRSLGTTAQPRIQDVTPQILKINNIYGSSDYTNPAYASSNRSLNYHEGGSIHQPEKDRVTIIPYTINYVDTVGLFGKENHFVRVDIAIDPSAAYACFSEEGWQCAIIRDSEPEQDGYAAAEIDKEKDLTIVNDYEPADILGNSLPYRRDAHISVDLENLKVSNQYIDSWFDVRLYKKNREEHPYNKMYVRMKDFFYIGFHARNTRRLPYNVKCEIGVKYTSGIPEGEERYANV